MTEERGEIETAMRVTLASRPTLPDMGLKLAA